MPDVTHDTLLVTRCSPAPVLMRRGQDGETHYMDARLLVGTRYIVSFFFIVCVLLLLLVIQPASAQDTPLQVDTSESLGEISPYVYGANYGPPTLVSLDLMPQAEFSGVTYFRIPAGRWGDENDLRPDMLDLYYSQAQKWGMELAVSLRLPGSGGTPEKAAELVQYAVDKGYAIRYWAIGNEPDLIKAYKTQQQLTDFADVKIEDYNRDWRAVAEAMLAVNPDIMLIGPDVSQFPPTEAGDPYNNVRREWVREFLRANGDLVDIVSIHRYPFPRTMDSKTTIDDMRQNTAEWDVLVNNLREVIRDATGGDMPMAITEANSHWSNGGNGEATPDSFYNGIWWADVLGRLITQKLEVVSYFSFQSVGSMGAFGLLERYEVRPTYYVYQLYQHFGTELISSQSSDPDVRIYAARRADGALTLMVINLGPDEKTKGLQFSGFTPGDKAEVWRFDVEHNAEQIGSADVSTGITVPGQSITLYVVPAG